MPADLTLLAPAFQDQVRIMLDACAQQGYILRPSEGLRDPYKQAIYWRQSPSIEQIEQKIASLEAAQLGFLAHCLRIVGPQHGPPVTKAIPGLSWHQWGGAVDCFWLVDGEAIGDLKRKVNGKDGIWGAFEIHITEQMNAVGRRAIVMAGPVLADDDEEKEYTRGTLKVPMRFWKVVACISADSGEEELLAYGVVFDQSEPIRTKGYEAMDMNDYEINQRSLAFITELRGVVFPDVLMDADVLKGARGEEGKRIERKGDVELRSSSKK